MADAALLRERAKYANRIGMEREFDDLSFGAAFNKAKREGRRDFPWRGKTYTTKTAEEQGREIKAAEGSGRGASAGRTAADRDMAPLRGEAAAEAPPPVVLPPAARSRASLSDIPGLLARGMAEGAERVPSGRGLGTAFTGAGAAYRGLKAAEAVAAAREAARRAAGAEERIEPMLERLPELGKGMWRSARERAVEPGFKRGGKVKAYAKGGSVKGSGCERRGLRKCKVY